MPIEMLDIRADVDLHCPRYSLSARSYIPSLFPVFDTCLSYQYNPSPSKFILFPSRVSLLPTHQPHFKRPSLFASSHRPSRHSHPNKLSSSPFVLDQVNMKSLAYIIWLTPLFCTQLIALPQPLCKSPVHYPVALPCQLFCYSFFVFLFSLLSIYSTLDLHCFCGTGEGGLLTKFALF